MQQLYENLIMKKPGVVLTVVGILFLLAAIKLPAIKLDASADSLVLEGDKSLDTFRKAAKRYGSEEFLLVAYSPEQKLYSDKVLGDIASLDDELRGLPGVSSVVSILDVPLIYSPRVSLTGFSKGINYLRDPNVNRKLAAQEFDNSPIYKNLLTSPDRSTTAIQVNLARDERNFELLNERDRLREKHRLEGLSWEETKELSQAEYDYRQYHTHLVERHNALVDRVREILARYRDDATIFLGGVPMIAADMIRFIQKDLLVFGTGIVAFFILMLAVIFRRIRWVLLPLNCCLVASVGMLGMLTWLDWRMTVISSNFVALLLIITLSISLHIIVRFRELQTLNPDATQYDLVRDSVSLMFKPCVYTGLTTIAAFASLVVSGIRPVIDFGWMMTIGVVMAMVVNFIVLPASLLMLRKLDVRAEPQGQQPLTLSMAAVTERFGTLILLLSGLIMVLSLIGMSKLKVENRFIDYFHSTTEIYQGMELIDRELGGTIPLDILIRVDEGAGPQLPKADMAASQSQASSQASVDDGISEDQFMEDFGDEQYDFDDEGDTSEPQSYWFTRAGLYEIERIHHFVDQMDETGKVISLATLYDIIRDIGGADVDDIQLAIVKKGLGSDIENVLVRPYLSDDGKESRISVRVMETSHTLQREELLGKVDRFLSEDMGYKKENYDLTGMLVLYNNMLQSLFRSQILTLGAVFLVIATMFTVLFRSVYIAIIAILPNVLAAAMVLGGMGFIGIPLDMMTITIAAITVGIGVDDCIHYIHRFQREFAKDRDYTATMYRCHGSIGKAMYYTSLTVIAGFSILVLSNFTPSIYFGCLTGFAMFSALLGALLLLPQLLRVLKPLGPESTERV